jgi:uncharacterized protein with GYD domain
MEPEVPPARRPNTVATPTHWANGETDPLFHSRSAHMAMFVVLGKFTTQGAKSLPDLRKFAEGNQERGSRLGAKVHGWYLTQGQYDFVVLAEAPDAETMLASSAGAGGTGNVHTETLRAFTLDEAEQVLKKLG